MRNREEKKCKKGQESTIGKIIYGFLLFMPLLAILSTCLYTIFNKNAYKSYSDKTQLSEFVEIQTFTTLPNNNLYFKYNDNTQGSSPVFDVVSTSLDLEALFPNKEINYIGVYTNTTHKYIVGATSVFTDRETKQADDIIDFSLETTGTILQGSYTNNNSGYKIYTYFYTAQKLDNVFYYAVDRVEQSNLFNWAQNSVIYTTTNATCNALNINNTFIPLLLSYWLIISVLYFLYDIALMLVWIVHRKIHDLQENF